MRRPANRRRRSERRTRGELPDPPRNPRCPNAPGECRGSTRWCHGRSSRNGGPAWKGTLRVPREFFVRALTAASRLLPFPHSSYLVTFPTDAGFAQGLLYENYVIKGRTLTAWGPRWTAVPRPPPGEGLCAISLRARSGSAGPPQLPRGWPAGR